MALLYRYADEKSTVEEKKQLESFVLKKGLADQIRKSEPDYSFLKDRGRKQLVDYLSIQNRSVRLRKRIKIVTAVAASFIFGFLLVKLLYIPNYLDNNKTNIYITEAVNPGDTSAILKLADGKKVFLGKHDGVLMEGHMQLAENSKGQELNYAHPQASDNQGLDAWNELIIPRGGQYVVVLSDGTRVTMNSASTLRYPVRFTGTDRVVSLEGEAYFEVEKDAKRPFRVLSKNQIVQVTGTKFNVKSYGQNAYVQTSLLEGGVLISQGDQQVHLSPGQQAQSSPGTTLKVRAFEEMDVLGWKNGNFVFDNKSLREIMEDIERWYNIDVSYEGEISSVKYGGNFTKSKGLKVLLNHLTKMTGNRFVIEGRRVTVKS